MAKPSVFSVLFSIVCAMSVGIASAASPETMPERFTQSELEKTVPIESFGHLVLFSPVREVNNEIRSESLARLQVSGEGRLYQISRDSSRSEAREYYRGLLRDRGAQILFECSSIRCGRSNVWANQIFGQSVLYGRDATQDYLVAAQVADGGSRWLTSIYTVTRGNRREYVWIEHLQVAAGAAIPGLDAGSSRVVGPVVVPWQGGVTFQFDWTATDRRKIGELASTEGARVVLVGYSGLTADESFDDSLDRARKAAESLSEVLTKTGISEKQQQLVIVGPSVAVNDPARQGDRVEVMVITR